MSYVVVAQEQPLRKEKETVVKPMQRRSIRIEQAKPTSQKKREKQMTSEPGKKRKTLRISSSLEFDEETGDRLV